MESDLCSECLRITAEYRAFINKAHDLRNRGLAIEMGHDGEKVKQFRITLIRLEQAAAVLKRELQEHQARVHNYTDAHI